MWRIGRLVLALAACAFLVSCGGPDIEQVRTCRLVVASLEPTGRIAITEEAADPVAANGVILRYRVDGKEGAQYVRCAFAGDRFSSGRSKLTAVETPNGELTASRLYILERFWLDDPQTPMRVAPRFAGTASPGSKAAQQTFEHSLSYALQQGLNALPVGFIYALLAVAFALVLGLVDRINFAFGDIAAIGGVAAFSGIGVSAFAASPALTIVLGLAFAIVCGAALGAAVGRTVLVPLRAASPLSFMIASIGLAIFLSESVRLLLGNRDRWIAPLLNDPMHLWQIGIGITMTPMQAAEVGAGLAATLLVGALIAMTRFGRAWRAIADDPKMAAMIGIDRNGIILGSLVISSALAALAGCLVTFHYGFVSHSSGLVVTLKALAAAILGGVGSIGGAAGAGILIAVAETLWAAYFPVADRDIAILALLTALLVLRPNGLFGRPLDASSGRMGSERQG
ncbi:LIV-I protein H [Hartmannibacter diazotrophicus]|uniref:LIV-I protein H n=1 Tax=Hartmannibacter diazotrophicus TaxID=1482074 RepID=A0A2C9D753_9HYPH|nr:branched-chain amino acid ABC transporter permease [Hartmannibacter diazotrophicus]SON56142.1 LIV-I protein H [Hartmannibacter diazotrophicus]